VRLKSGLAASTYNNELQVCVGGGSSEANISCSGSVSPAPSPSLALSPTALTGFSYLVGMGPSVSQSYMLNGSYLTSFPDSIVVTAPLNYEISSDNNSFSAMLKLPYTGAFYASTPVYVRLKAGLPVGNYNNELIVHTGGGAVAANLSCSGYVAPMPSPSLVASVSSLSGFNYMQGSGPSTSQSYNLSGTHLTGYPGNISINAPTNYEISLASGSGYSSSLSLSYTSSTLSSTPVYVRLKAGLSVGNYNNELVVNAGGGAADISVSCSGTVSPVPSPSLTASPTTLSGFTYIEGSGPSSSQSYSLSGTYLTGYPGIITISAPTNYEVSEDNTNYANSITIDYTSAMLSSTLIYVRLKSGLSINTYNGETIVNSGGGATAVNVSCNGSVTAVPPPTLNVNAATLSGFNYIVGAGPSACAKL
jgi:trimeric autotransporter adhesin